MELNKYKRKKKEKKTIKYMKLHRLQQQSLQQQPIQNSYQQILNIVTTTINAEQQLQQQ